MYPVKEKHMSNARCKSTQSRVIGMWSYQPDDIWKWSGWRCDRTSARCKCSLCSETAFIKKKKKQILPRKFRCHLPAKENPTKATNSIVSFAYMWCRNECWLDLGCAIFNDKSPSFTCLFTCWSTVTVQAQLSIQGGSIISCTSSTIALGGVSYILRSRLQGHMKGVSELVATPMLTCFIDPFPMQPILNGNVAFSVTLHQVLASSAQLNVL